MPIDPKTLYWTGALVNLAAIVGLGVYGVHAIRCLDVAAHRRAMTRAAWLIVAFLVSYALKLATLGRESLELWAPLYLNVLRFHELCVLLMIVAGARALWLGARRGVESAPQDSPLRSSHRLAGRLALISAVLGVTTATVLLYGMYARM